MSNINTSRTNRRKKRVSSNIRGTAERPRISIYRSNRYIYAQAVDDAAKTTLAAYSSAQLKSAKNNKVDQSKQVGLELASLLKKKNVSKGVFDRGRFTYKGRVKALAEGLREGGLEI